MPDYAQVAKNYIQYQDEQFAEQNDTRKQRELMEQGNHENLINTP